MIVWSFPGGYVILRPTPQMSNTKYSVLNAHKWPPPSSRSQRRSVGGCVRTSTASRRIAPSTSGGSWSRSLSGTRPPAWPTSRSSSSTFSMRSIRSPREAKIETWNLALNGKNVKKVENFKFLFKKNVEVGENISARCHSWKTETTSLIAGG